MSDDYELGERMEMWADEMREEIAQLNQALAEAREVMKEVSLYAPEDDTNYACIFCDMGGSGRSSKGDNHHDDLCAVHAARAWLAKHKDGGGE